MTHNKVKCTICRTKFNIGSEQLNYKNYKKFSFKSEEKFKNHNKGNKNCPSKQIVTNHMGQDGVQGITMTSSDAVSGNEVSDTWPPYIENTETDEDHFNDSVIVKNKYEKHKRGGRTLWFEESYYTSQEIIDHIMGDKDIHYITLVAEPGSGKTMVVHCLIYHMYTAPRDISTAPTNITLTTGMSDKEWFEQVKNNFKLKDGDYLWNEINKIADNHCITHRATFSKRINYLKNNKQFLHNHIFIIDESHFADEKEMTIDKEFKNLGLTKERIVQYNIKMIFISATPDVNLSIMGRNDKHEKVQLTNGENYKGFKHYYDNDRIYNDEDITDISDFITTKFTRPKYHYMRIRTQHENGDTTLELNNKCAENGWKLYNDNSEENYYISFCKDEYEEKAIRDGKTIITTYIEPDTHTIIHIKNKYQASKRLKITEFTGLIYEKKSKDGSVTVTGNGLIPRFFGYYDTVEFYNNEPALFMGDKESIRDYIKFSEDFDYTDKNYSSSKLKSDKDKLTEKKNTGYSNTEGMTPITDRHNIDMSGPFKKDFNIQNFLLENRGFRDHNIGVDDSCGGVKGNDGYMYPKRNVPGHTRNTDNNTFLTEKSYEKFKHNGGGSNINQNLESGAGQRFMVYPVYPNENSDTEDFVYYVHSLIMP